MRRNRYISCGENVLIEHTQKIQKSQEILRFRWWFCFDVRQRNRIPRVNKGKGFRVKDSERVVLLEGVCMYIIRFLVHLRQSLSRSWAPRLPKGNLQLQRLTEKTGSFMAIFLRTLFSVLVVGVKPMLDELFYNARNPWLQAIPNENFYRYLCNRTSSSYLNMPSLR